jgi:capping protein beta
MKGAWDSIHVFKANERGRNAHYKLTSTVMLYTITSKPELGHMNLSGSMTRQVKKVIVSFIKMSLLILKKIFIYGG